MNVRTELCKAFPVPRHWITDALSTSWSSTMLTQEILIDLFTYQNGHLIRKKTINNRAKVGDIAGTYDREGYLQIQINRKIYRAHRLVWLMLNGPIPVGMEMDHINGIKDDNRIENLRLATSSQNKHNQKKRRINKSGFKGVSWSKKMNKWSANICVKGKNRGLGFFDDKLDAAKAYDVASKELHKDFALINF